MENILENNQVTIIGRVITEFRFSCEVFGENFYTVDVQVNRKCDYTDIIPVIISEHLMDVHHDYTNECIMVKGQFRSYNYNKENTHRLILSVFAKEITFVEKDTADTTMNVIRLDGYICKKPLYRKTPLGRYITDLMLAVNRPYGKADYIPLICWGKYAELASHLKAGDHISVLGRIQSREYIKKLSDTEIEERTAYEVSASKIKIN